MSEDINDDPAANNIDDIEIVPNQDNGVDTESIKEMPDSIPDMSDPKWSEYVLSQLEDDEVINGNPKTDGLRRIVQKLLGPIISSRPVQVFPPSFANNNHATVVWELSIRFDDGSIRTFGDCADVSPDNTDMMYAVHASATASTKAEGRALRKALQLKFVLAAEEVSYVAPVDDKKINSGQISFLTMMCNRLDIDLKKMLLGGKKTKFDNIQDVPYGVAVQMGKFLSDCANGKQGAKIPTNWLINGGENAEGSI